MQPLNAAQTNSLPIVAWIGGITFLLANMLVPWIWGDVYPFTSSPMFRDAPLRYANIRVFGPDGKELADNSTRRNDPTTTADPFLIRRYYDGNPVGFGVGIKPPSTLDQFGEVPSEKEVRNHFHERLLSLSNLDYVEVELEIIGPINQQQVGVQSVQRWRITRERLSGR